MPYVGKKATNVVDVSETQSLTVDGDLTVDTSTLKVDSANNRVGVGTASPAFALDVQSTGDPAQIRLKEDGNTHGVKIVNFDGDEAQINNVDNGPLVIKTNDTERMRITNAGFVGVGTNSPETPIEIETTNKLGGTFTGTTDGEGLRVTQTNYTAGNYVSLVEAPYDDSQTAANVRIAAMFDGGGSNLAFGTSNSYGSGITNTAMFIDSSGLVGILTATPSNASIDVAGRGRFLQDAAATTGAVIIRESSGGVGGHLQFVNNANDAQRGFIASDSSGDLVLAANSGAGLKLDGSNVLPANGSGVAVDNDRDLGSSSHRWRDIFTDGAVTTSDQNKKQQIATLTSSEIAAAKRISALFKTFKFNNAVTKKGDSARIHAGVIAQEVYTALEAEGLDATKYAFWCSDTWWEKDVEVPAVEADKEKAIEAQDAYTRTDTYNTKDEAPEGATETTRLSVRYAELMAFVGAATEQRLSDIETRLAALEG